MTLSQITLIRAFYHLHLDQGFAVKPLKVLLVIKKTPTTRRIGYHSYGDDKLFWTSTAKIAAHM